MTTAEILRASLELLEDPDHWTQGARGRDHLGRAIHPRSPYARQWCIEGAPLKVTGERLQTSSAVWMLRRAVSPDWCVAAYHYNDAEGRQHSEVLDVIRRAIELAEAEEQHA